MAKLTDKQKLEALLPAWWAVFGDQALKSYDVFKRTGGGAQKDPAIRKLRAAMEALFPIGVQLNVNRLGTYLRRHIGEEHAGYSLGGSYNTSISVWYWYVFKPSIITIIEPDSEFELGETVQRVLEARLGGKGTEEQLARLEKDYAKLDIVDERRDAVGAIQLQKEQQAIDKAEALAKAQAEGSHKYIYLAPLRGWFIFEAKTEKLVRQLQEIGFQASIGYLSANHYVIWIDGSPDMKALRQVAERFLIKIYETASAPTKTKPQNSNEQIWDDRTQQWLPADWYTKDHTSERLLRQAFESPARAGGVHRSTPFLEFNWSVFN